MKLDQVSSAGQGERLVGRDVQHVAKVVAGRVDGPRGIGLKRIKNHVGDFQRRVGVSGDRRAAVGVLIVEQVDGILYGADVGLDLCRCAFFGE